MTTLKPRWQYEQETAAMLRDQLLAGARRAEKACAGFVHYTSGGPVQVGRKNIDWLGGHINHQEWHHQLNRFFDMNISCEFLNQVGK